MAQSDQVIENATFPSLRADINDNLNALYSNSSGTSEPPVTTGSMFWCDTTNNCLKMRSEDDSSWYGIYKTDGSQLYASGSSAAVPAYSKYDDVNTGLFFPAADVIAISTNATERIRFNSNGNVGIGTSAPSYALSCVKTTTGTHAIEAVNNTTGAGSTRLILSNPNSDTNINGFQIINNANDGSVNLINYKNTSLAFWTNAAERMRIHSNGKVAFYNANVEVGSITTSGSSTSYNTSSDYRLKENVKPIADAVSRLMQLKPSRFNFISDKNKTVDGFIAHEIEEIVPECVTGTKDGMKIIGNIVNKDGKVIQEKVEKPEDLKEGQKWEKTGEEADYQGIDQSKIVPLVVGAVQELSKEMQELSKEIEDLKNN